MTGKILQSFEKMERSEEIRCECFLDLEEGNGNDINYDWANNVYTKPVVQSGLIFN